MDGDKWTGLTLSLAFSALLAASVLGIRGCILDDRATEKACRAAGGTITGLGAGQGCFRITMEPVVVP